MRSLEMIVDEKKEGLIPSIYSFDQFWVCAHMIFNIFIMQEH